MTAVLKLNDSFESQHELAIRCDNSALDFRYIGGSYSSCSVQIRGVKLSDAGQYHFRFETDQPLGRWTSPDTITLDVTGKFIQNKTYCRIMAMTVMMR